MNRLWWLLQVLIILLCCSDNLGEDSHFLNEWVAEIEGSLDQARDIAKRHGFEVIRELDYFDNHYILKHVDVRHRSKRSARHHTRRLTDDSMVKWAEQQRTRQRTKRGIFDLNTRAGGSCDLNDPLVPYEWYLQCSRPEARGHHSRQRRATTMRVEEAWRRGYSGKNVTICIVDDGLEHTHPDLQANYDPEASCDLNDDDLDPSPRYDPSNENAHGTRCAGVVAMQANNGLCGAGVAFNSKIGGIRMLDGRITDRSESSSFIFKHDRIDIYSVSWGPTDNGKICDRPGKLTIASILTAIHNGRGGKGAIYVWAAGDGGRKDNCNCDGYTSSVYSVSVNSATRGGTVPSYSEACPSTLTTTYSSGHMYGVVSTDIHKGCTKHHSGTSASAPLAAGIIALALEANPNLTWRDVQHLIVMTSDPRALAHNPGWYRNGVGLCVSLDFGFGLMDAGLMVEQAEIWEMVPPQVNCTVRVSDHNSTTTTITPLPQKLSSGGEVTVTFTSDGCQGQDNEVNYLEHVQFVFTVRYSRRGALSATVVSPAGTETQLLSLRPRDTSKDGFDHWALMSVHTWGENPAGVWIFRVRDDGRYGGNNEGVVERVEMVLYGTRTPPSYPKPSPCHLKTSEKSEERKISTQDFGKEGKISLRG